MQEHKRNCIHAYSCFMHIRFLKLLAVAIFALLSGSILCSAANLVAIPRATGLIVDQAGLLSDTDRAALEARLKKIQASGRAQIGVLISPGTGDEALAPYALRVAEAWQLGGKELDNGLLILIVPSQKTARVDVGYGLEEDIPDARSAALVRDYLQLAPGGAAAALNAMLDKIDRLLPAEFKKPRPYAKLVRQHADWKTPIIMLVLSVFTLFPLLLGAVRGALSSSFGSGEKPARAFPSAGTIVAALISACLFAGVMGFAASAFWDSTTIGREAAAIAFVLPLLWSLNSCDSDRLGIFARIGYVAGNLGLFAYIFSTLTIVAGAAMYVENVQEIWIAPLFGVLFAAGALVFILGGRLGQWLMKFVGYYLYFLVTLAIAYFALQGVLKDPATTAVTVAAVFATLIAIGFTLDDRRKATHGRKGRWAWAFTAAAVLFLLPFMLVALVHALTGDAFTTRFAIVMAGDGTFSEFVWWASGALGGSALLVGLGGKFGGGGAGN
jgi:uncharacterized protein